MNTRASSITVNGLRVEIVRKAIKNLHLGVYPPNGRIRVAAPLAVNDEAVRLAVVTRLPWIKKQQAGFSRQERQSARRYVSGETYFLFGQRYRLRVVYGDDRSAVEIKKTKTMALRVPPGSDASAREKAMSRWYRQQLRGVAHPLVAKWSGLIGVAEPDWGIKRMKTKWGSCSKASRRIWLNLELAKKPPQCLEFVVVHELAHLIERTHNERFIKLLDRHLPNWRTVRAELNAAPLKHEIWP
jgi:predicted metal-dependent hydrolase